MYTAGVGQVLDDAEVGIEPRGDVVVACIPCVVVDEVDRHVDARRLALLLDELGVLRHLEELLRGQRDVEAVGVACVSEQLLAVVVLAAHHVRGLGGVHVRVVEGVVAQSALAVEERLIDGITVETERDRLAHALVLPGILVDVEEELADARPLELLDFEVGIRVQGLRTLEHGLGLHVDGSGLQLQRGG